MVCFEPIGFFKTKAQEKYALPRQGASAKGNEGIILLNPKLNFEQALEGLERFGRIWVLSHFHLNQHWKPKVAPPRGGKKRGVFATRSPYRPNGIGLSCVQLLAIEGRSLHIINHDLMDDTPILDIKPYLVYADSFQEDYQENHEKVSFQWSAEADQQAHYLASRGLADLKENVESILGLNPLPSSYNRIRKLQEGLYLLSLKTWRILYRLEGRVIAIQTLYSGYDQATLQGEKNSLWPDVPLHQSFNKLWPETPTTLQLFA